MLIGFLFLNGARTCYWNCFIENTNSVNAIDNQCTEFACIIAGGDFKMVAKHSQWFDIAIRFTIL